MTEERTDYIFDSDTECERLEKQAKLEGLERYLRYLPILESGDVLDAGCGEGSMVRLLAARSPSARVVGSDINSRFLAYAERRAATDGLTNASFRQGDVQDLPFDDASFDVVWSHFVLYFVPDPGKAIAEFRRVLKPDGRLVIVLNYHTMLDNYPPDPSLQPRLDKVVNGIVDVDVARRSPLMCAEAGFTDINCEMIADPVYNIIGSATAAQHENIEVALTAGMARVASVLGSREEAERFLADLLVYVDRPDSYSFNTLWIITARA